MVAICNKNDFIIKLKLTDKDGVVLPYTQFDWEIWFYTARTTPFKTYCKDGVLKQGTTIVGEYLYITVNGFDWGYMGDVFLKVYTTFNNSLFIDGRETFSNTPYLVTSFKIAEPFTYLGVNTDDDGVIIQNVEIEESLIVPFRVGLDGKNVYMAFASDEQGGNFSLSPQDGLGYVAFLNVNDRLDELTPDLFEGLWIKYYGKSSYEVWLLSNPDGTFEEYEAWLRQPATDASNEVQELISDIEAAEQTRKNNEDERIAAELLRQQNTAIAIQNAEGATQDAIDATQDAISATNAAIDAAQAAADNANDAAELANQKAGFAEEQGNYAKGQGELAGQKAGLANDAANLAVEKAALAEQKAEDAEQAAQEVENYISEHNTSETAHSDLFAAKENIGVAASLISQLIDGASVDYNTLKKIQEELKALKAVINGVGEDGNNIIDTVVEMLTVFSTYPEGTNIVELFATKVNVTDVYNALDCVIEGKVLDARQGKALNDAIAALSTSKADKTYTDTELAKKVDKVEGKQLSTEDYTTAEKTKLSQLKTDNWVGVIVDGSLSCTEPAPKSTVTAYKATELARTGNLNFHKFGQSRIFNAIYPAIVNRTEKTVAWVLDKNDFTKKVDGSASAPDWTIHNICIVIPTLYRRVTVLNPAVADCKYEIAYDIEPFEGATLFHEESFHGISDAQKDRTLNTLVQVVSDDVRYRGGGNQAAWDVQSWRSQLGMPCIDTSRTNFEAYADAAGWQTMNIYDWTLFHELALLYFANSNIQLDYTTTLTPEGYPQGGLGAGNTTWIGKRWGGKTSYYPLDKVGEGSMSVGCNVGVKSKTVSDYYIGVTTSIAANKVIGTAEFSAGNGWLAAYIGYTINNLTTGQSATITAKDSDDQLSLSADIFTATNQIFQIVGSTFTYSIPVFFGLENLYGHLWKFCSGINFMVQAADSGGKSLAYVNPVWATRSAVNVDAYTLIGEIPRADGYIKSLITGWNVPKNTTGGSSTSYMSDYLYQTVPANGVSLRCLLVSGSASSGAFAGLRYVNSAHAPSTASSYFGARLRAKKV